MRTNIITEILVIYTWTADKIRNDGDPNLVTRAFSLFKMTLGETPWPRLLKCFTNRGVFCHMTHDKFALLEVVSSVWRLCLFSAIGNRYSNQTKTFHRVCVTKFWRTFGATLAALARGFSYRHFERGEDPGDEVDGDPSRLSQLEDWLIPIVFRGTNMSF